VHTTGTAEEAWYDDDAGPVARPYTMTGGRTAPERGHLDLISLLVARQAATPVQPLFPEQARIVELCHHPLSVAEVGAELDLPLGTVRVLLGDLLAAGLIETHEPPTLSERPSKELLEAILVGLRAL
jgi:DNA-directed RNA polymerase specialized sigma24 family protein